MFKLQTKLPGGKLNEEIERQQFYLTEYEPWVILVSDLLYEVQQLMRIAVQHEAWFLLHLYKFHQHASSGSCFTVQNSWLSYQTYSHNENDTSLVTVVVKLYHRLYHIHICPIAPQNHPGENISLLQFNPLKINWTGSIMCCCLNQESCNTHW